MIKIAIVVSSKRIITSPSTLLILRSVLPPWLLPRLMPTPGTAPTATPTGATPTGDTTATGTTTGDTGTDPQACRRDTGTTSTRGPLMPSPRLMLTPGTVPTTPTPGATAATGTTTDADAWYRPYYSNSWGYS